jgi:hypothetical protein
MWDGAKKATKKFGSIVIENKRIKEQSINYL